MLPLKILTTTAAVPNFGIRFKDGNGMVDSLALSKKNDIQNHIILMTSVFQLAYI